MARAAVPPVYHPRLLSASAWHRSNSDTPGSVAQASEPAGHDAPLSADHIRADDVCTPSLLERDLRMLPHRWAPADSGTALPSWLQASMKFHRSFGILRLVTRACIPNYRRRHRHQCRGKAHDEISPSRIATGSCVQLCNNGLNNRPLPTAQRSMVEIPRRRQLRRSQMEGQVSVIIIYSIEHLLNLRASSHTVHIV
ncbi:hypothetical protein HYPSUDRAFT_409703 [Hypholoma sublateritium FD-334 SS-4]|uniref:Uncharacterized protein n=1 Tax=Hypholoma sublateritium (strain FD-334 SS-4) TaxID=945553 RepID=A0A0D2Q270_HYPSF|nr:hypothetical protein HYPSUDRAFT_409703 [Hypholoma sublateritium FD-334 SS-4]